MMPTLTAAETQWQAQLLAQELATQAACEQVAQARQAAWEKAWNGLSGVYCYFEDGHLYLQRIPSGEILNRWPAPPREGRAWGEQQMLLQPQDGRLLHVQPQGPRSGLLINAQSVFCVGGHPSESPWLGESATWHGTGDCAYDLSAAGEFLFVSDRWAGEVIVLSLVTGAELARLPVRESGSQASMVVAALAEWAYLVDGVSGQLWRVNYQHWDLHALDTQLGILSNICRAPDPRLLYLLVQAPVYSLVQYDVQGLSVIQEHILQGYPLSAREAPCDLMCLSPSSQRIFVLGGLYDPEAQQSYPLIQVFRAHSGRHAREEVFPEPLRLSGLMTAHANPLFTWKSKSLSDWWIELGLLSAQSVSQLRRPLISQDRSDYVLPGNDTEALQLSAPPIRWADEAKLAIVRLLTQVHFQQGLTGDSATLETLLTPLAERLKHELETHYAVQATVETAPGQESFLLQLKREVVVHETHRYLQGQRSAYQPAHRCPMCQTKWLAIYPCPRCQFRLEPQQWLQRREKMSAERHGSLLPGQLILILSESTQLVLLNRWHQVLWQIGFAEVGLGHVQEIVALPQQRYLAAQVGQCFVLDAQAKIQCHLQGPIQNVVQLTWYRHETGLRYLGVDRDLGRISEWDEKGELTCYWDADTGLVLNQALDVQLTWAGTLLITHFQQVIEIERSGQLQSVWGTAQGLKRPVLARRLPSGETLIVDADLGQILLWNTEGQLIDRFRYWPPPGRPELAMVPAPDQVSVLSTQELLFRSPQYWLQCNWLQKQLLWVKPWNPALMLQRRTHRDKRGSLLRHLHFLREAPAEVVSLLSQAFQPERVSAGNWIVLQHQWGDCLYLLSQGEVEVFKDGNARPIAVMGAGQIFGEMALILHTARNASVQAKTDCELLKLDRKDFDQVVAAFPDFSRHLQQMAEKRQQHNQAYKQELEQSLLQRVKARMVLSRLRDLRIFEGAEPAFLERLAEHMRPEAYLPDKTVFHEGESGDTLFFIARGTVEVWVKGQVVNQLKSGDVFGEIAILLDLPRSATIRTRSYCQFYVLERRHYLHILGLYPDFQERLQAVAEARIQRDEEWVSEATLAAEVSLRALVLSHGNVWPLSFYALSRERHSVWRLDEQGQQSIFPLQGSLFYPERICVLDQRLWICDTGHQRVLCVDAEGHIQIEWKAPKWEWLNPTSAVPSADGHVLVTDAGQGRIVLLSPAGDLLWEYQDPQLKAPVYAELTPTDSILYCDREQHWVGEIDPKTNRFIWSYGSLGLPGASSTQLSEPHCVRRLSNGGTLIVDTGNDRLLLLDESGLLLKVLNGDEAMPLRRPLHCELLPNGEILVFGGRQEEVVRLDLRGQPYWRAVLV